MHKTIMFILTALTVLLFITAFATCSRNVANLKDSSAQRLQSPFTCTVDVTFGDKSYEVTLLKKNDGIYTMKFIKPSELSQLGFELTSQGMKVQFDDIVASVDPSSVPQTALVNALFDAFDAAAAKNDITAARSGSDIVLSGSTQAGGFNLTLSSDLIPKSLTIGAVDLKAVFKDFKFTNS